MTECRVFKYTSYGKLLSGDVFVRLGGYPVLLSENKHVRTAFMAKLDGWPWKLHIRIMTNRGEDFLRDAPSLR